MLIKETKEPKVKCTEMILNSPRGLVERGLSLRLEKSCPIERKKKRRFPLLFEFFNFFVCEFLAERATQPLSKCKTKPAKKYAKY